MGYHSPNLWNPAHPTLNLFFFCLVLCFLFYFSLFPSFFSPILHLNPCWDYSNIYRLRGCQRQAIECSHTTHFPKKHTGASPSWECYRNTLPVSGRPKIRAIETPTISLLGALPCWIQGKTPWHTQTSGSEKGEHTYHLRWSLRGTWHRRSRDPNIPTLIPPEALSERVGFATNLKLTAGWQREIGKVDPAVTWVTSWHTPGCSADKTKLSRAAWTTLGTAKPGGINHKQWITSSFELAYISLRQHKSYIQKQALYSVEMNSTLFFFIIFVIFLFHRLFISFVFFFFFYFYCCIFLSYLLFYSYHWLPHCSLISFSIFFCYSFSFFVPLSCCPLSVHYSH